MAVGHGRVHEEGCRVAGTPEEEPAVAGLATGDGHEETVWVPPQVVDEAIGVATDGQLVQPGATRLVKDEDGRSPLHEPARLGHRAGAREAFSFRVEGQA